MTGASIPTMVSASTPAPRRQFNVRLPADLWDRIEARRTALGLSRDEWARRSLEHLLATTTPPTTSMGDNDHG